MASLTGQSISSTYDSLLKLTDNGPITTSFKEITDGLGGSTKLFVKNNGSFGFGAAPNEISADINVGVTGTSAPAFNVLNSTTGDYISLETASTFSIIQAGNTGAANYNALSFYVGGSERAKIATTGQLSLNNYTSASSFTGTAAGYLAFTSAGNIITVAAPSSGITGSGTTNTLPKFTASTALGDSNITDTGTLISLGSNTTISSGSLGIGTSSLTGYNLALGKTITGAGTSMAVYQTGTVQSDVTSSAFGFRNDLNTQAATFTLPVYTHYQAQQGTVGAGTTLTTQIGFNAGTLTGGANVFGFRGQVASTSGRWNLYMDGTANNYLAGSLGIGTTSLTGYNVRVGKSLTGSTSMRGIYQESVIQSDVTALAAYNTTYAGTQAAAFTLTNIYHYEAVQGTFGASSAVTNQTGFRVDSSLIGATNNYGFRGLLASATGRWNLYMDGTANNYLNGNLGIGIAIPNAKLEVYVDANSFQGSQITNINTGNIAGSVTNYYNGTVNQKFGAIGSGFTTYGVLAANDAFVYSVGGGIAIAAEGSNSIKFGTGSSTPERMRINSSGNILIGSTTDNNTGAKLQVTGAITYQNTFNRQTASYTLALTDQNDIVEMNGSSTNNVTVPPNSSVAFPIGTEIQVLQYSTLQTTIVAGAGVTLNSKSGQLKIGNRYTGVTLLKVGTNEWYVIGNVAA